MNKGDDTTTLPPTLRARLWVRARHLVRRAEDRSCWLWLLRDDGRLHALQLEASLLYRDDRLSDLLDWIDSDPNSPLHNTHQLGLVKLLPGACAVPPCSWAVSWGHPFRRQVRTFAAQLDRHALRALGQLEVPGPFFGSVSNYNRFANLPRKSRQRRMQALQTFPPLVAPLLLDVFGYPDHVAHNEDEPRQRAHDHSDASVAALQSIDRGDCLVDALARYHRIDRALVRSPLFRQPWKDAHAPRELLRLLREIPAHARPRDQPSVEFRQHALKNLPVHLHSTGDFKRLASIFAGGWDNTWNTLAATFADLDNLLRDSHDFLESALDQRPPDPELGWLDLETLGLAWLARRGPASLLHATRRWHQQPALPYARDTSLPESLPPIIGFMTLDDGHARELNSQKSLFDEGESMHHCVGGYWPRCVHSATRHVHLCTTEGETATAQYTLNPSHDDLEFALTELRGPHNAASGDAMQRLAQSVLGVLNADPQADARKQAWQVASQTQSQARPSERRHPMRTLDRRSRNELRLVLAYCRRQDDWMARGREICHSAVAGFAYHEGLDVLHELETGAALQLVREPDNPHDPLAVRVDWQGRKLGDVPRADNAPIAQDLDGGHSLSALVTKVRYNIHHHQPVEFVIRRDSQHRESTPAAPPARTTHEPAAAPAQ